MSNNLKQLIEDLAKYIENGDDGVVKISKKAIEEVIILLKNLENKENNVLDIDQITN